MRSQFVFVMPVPPIGGTGFFVPPMMKVKNGGTVMNKLIIGWAALVFAALVAGTGVQAEGETPTSQQTVEERLAILERKYEIAQEEVSAKSKDGSGVVANRGF